MGFEHDDGVAKCDRSYCDGLRQRDEVVDDYWSGDSATATGLWARYCEPDAGGVDNAAADVDPSARSRSKGWIRRQAPRAGTDINQNDKTPGNTYVKTKKGTMRKGSLPNPLI